ADGSRAPSEGLDTRASRLQSGKAGSLIDWIVERGTSAVELADGTVRVATGPTGHATSTDDRDPLTTALEIVTMAAPKRAHAAVESSTQQPIVRALAVPLRARDRTVGVLRIASTDALRLSPEQARLLTALAYYAALGAERARLTATAERAEAERRV